MPGFLSPLEGRALTEAAASAGSLGPIVEIGAYCGRSTLYLATGAAQAGALVVSIDHHRGSEEHQPGESHHDPTFWDAAAGQVDTLPALRGTLRRAGVEDQVIVCVGRSKAVAGVTSGPVGLVFIDGGHAMATALTDWRAWAGRIAPGGMLAIHDVHADPREGGRPPYVVFEMARASGLFDPVDAVGSLHRLRRLS